MKTSNACAVIAATFLTNAALSGTAIAETQMLAVNMGGEAVTSGDAEYATEAYVTGGNVTVDDERGNGLQEGFIGTVYQTNRWGGQFDLALPVPPGDYVLELHFAETYHNDPGARIMEVSVEGTPVLRDFDILGVNGGDINVPVVQRIEGVRPDAAGDPGLIEIRMNTIRDNALLSAVRVICTDTDAACRERSAAAEAERLAAAERAAAAARAYWQGYWVFHESGRNDWDEMQRAMYDNGVVVTERGAIAAIRLRDMACQFVFGPGDRPEDMPYMGDNCPASRTIEAFRLLENHRGGLTLAGKINGRDWALDYFKELDARTRPATPPAGVALDIVGITLAPTVAEQMAMIEAAFPDPRTPDAKWTRQTYRSGGARWIYETEARADWMFRHSKNAFAVFSDQDAETAAPMAIARYWHPDSAEQPLPEVLTDALIRKYGPPSQEIMGSVSRTRIGIQWNFDMDGNLIEGACPMRELQSFNGRVIMDDRTVGQSADISVRSGCGWSIDARFPTYPGRPVDEASFVISDVSRLAIGFWERMAGRFDDRVASVMEQSAAQSAQQDRQKKVVPDL